MKWKDFILRKDLKISDFLSHNNILSPDDFELWRKNKGIESLTDQEKDNLFPKAQQLESSVVSSENKPEETLDKSTSIESLDIKEQEPIQASTLELVLKIDDTEITSSEEPKKRGRKKKVEDSENSNE